MRSRARETGGANTALKHRTGQNGAALQTFLADNTGPSGFRRKFTAVKKTRLPNQSRVPTVATLVLAAFFKWWESNAPRPSAPAFFRFLSHLATLAALVPDVGDDAEAAGDEVTVTVPTVAIYLQLDLHAAISGRQAATYSLQD